MECKIQRHAIHTVISGALVKNHNPIRKKWKRESRKMKWRFDLGVIILSYFLLSVTVASWTSEHGSIFFSLTISSPCRKDSSSSTKTGCQPYRKSTARSKTQFVSILPFEASEGNTATQKHPRTRCIRFSFEVHQHFNASQSTVVNAEMKERQYN